MSFSTEFGGSSTLFGSSDYAAALLPHARNPEELRNTRNRVLDWLSNNQHLLWSENREGSGGLYDWIADTETIRTDWGEANDPARKDWFGHADLDATRAAGHEDAAILSWLSSQNPTVLRDANRPVSEGGEASGVWGVLHGSQDTRPTDPGEWPHTTWPTDSYIPPERNVPTVTNNPVEWNERTNLTIGRDDRNSLKINTGGSTLTNTRRGVNKTKTLRPKYKQTTDLARQARNSLNIS